MSGEAAFYRGILFSTLQKISKITGIQPVSYTHLLGIASAISPVRIITENIIDLCVLLAFTVCAWIFAGTKKKIGRTEGFCMVALYAVYAVYIIVR